MYLGAQQAYILEGFLGFQQASVRLDELREECVSFLSHICSIPALGPDNGGTGEMAKYIPVKEMVMSLVPDRVEEIHAPDSRTPEGVRPNLVALFKGRDTSRTLWILSHIDVVPVGELRLWDADPFKPYVKDGYLIGRGVEDNGQAVASSIYAVKAVKETCGLGINVGLALVSDEECGSLFGLDYILKKRPELFSRDDLILVPDAGNKDGDVMEIAEKHLYHVRFCVTGKQAHASRPDKGKNTLRAAARMISALDDALHDSFREQNHFFNPPVSTFEPTRKDANVPNVNTIPGEDVFFFDSRILPETRVDDVLALMREVSSRVAAEQGVEVTVQEYLRSESPNATASDAPVVVALAQAIQEVYGVQARPQGIGGQTVATFFRKADLPAVVWERMEGWAHAPNERIPIDNLIGNAKVFARMMV